MSAISWLWGSGGLKPGDNVYVPGNDVPDYAELERQRVERQRQRETAHGQAAERDFVDQRAARQADLAAVELPAGEILRRFPEVAKAMAHAAAKGRPIPPLVVNAYGPHDGQQAMRDERAMRDRAVADAIRAGALPPSYTQAFIDEVPL